MSDRDPHNPYAPQSDPENPVVQGGAAPSQPQFGRRSESWTPNAGPSAPQPNQDAQNPWPVYGGQSQPATPPTYGQPAQSTPNPYNQPYEGHPVPPTPYLAQGAQQPLTPPPGRGGPLSTLIMGFVVMIIIAPFVFMAVLFGSIGMDRLLDGSLQGSNGNTVVVDETGVVGVTPLDGTATSCVITGESGETVELFDEDGSGILIARGVAPGNYSIACEGVPVGATLIVLNGGMIENIVSSSLSALGWATLVGVIGLGMVIGGIVWLVKRNGQIKAHRQGLPY